MSTETDTLTTESHLVWMKLALEQAEKARAQDEVPVGAILVQNGRVIGAGYNQPIGSHDPTAHAEVQAIRAASQNLGNYRLPDTHLYVTIEPCAMCVGAMIHARINTLIFGSREPKAGAVVSQLQLPEASYVNHKIKVIEGILEEECRVLMQSFFQAKRAKT